MNEWSPLRRSRIGRHELLDQSELPPRELPLRANSPLMITVRSTVNIGKADINFILECDISMFLSKACKWLGIRRPGGCVIGLCTQNSKEGEKKVSRRTPDYC